jgi:hypothetical protein
MLNMYEFEGGGVVAHFNLLSRYRRDYATKHSEYQSKKSTLELYTSWTEVESIITKLD